MGGFGPWDLEAQQQISTASWKPDSAQLVRTAMILWGPLYRGRIRLRWKKGGKSSAPSAQGIRGQGALWGYLGLRV